MTVTPKLELLLLLLVLAKAALPQEDNDGLDELRLAMLARVLEEDWDWLS